jgi:hypothetical protein
MTTFAQVESLAAIAPSYRAMRQANPTVRAADVHRFLSCGGDGLTLEQFCCRHDWACTGTEYGGDDDSYHGEGRCYCTKCGADGDA